MRWKVVVALFIIFNILDGLITIYGIKVGQFYEANPLVAVVMAKVGLLWAFILMKGLSCIGGLFIFFRIGRVSFASSALLFSTAVMFSVVVYSIFLLASAG